jgi:hypothetical protein
LQNFVFLRPPISRMPRKFIWGLFRMIWPKFGHLATMKIINNQISMSRNCSNKSTRYRIFLYFLQIFTIQKWLPTLRTRNIFEPGRLQHGITLQKTISFFTFMHRWAPLIETLTLILTAMEFKEPNFGKRK